MTNTVIRQEIEQFYNGFSGRRMARYRPEGNKRIDLAVRFIRENLGSARVVADIGCGVGIVTEALARAMPQGAFFGVDISDTNIKSARGIVNLPNVQFLHASVVEEFEKLKDWIGRPLDAVCMVDVIEHIPQRDRPGLFARLGELAAGECALLITYPSVEYQRYLLENDPSELQVVDNEIETDRLISEANAAGWRLTYFHYVDVWKSNQYVHARFHREVSLRDIPVPREHLLRKGVRRFQQLVLPRVRPAV